MPRPRVGQFFVLQLWINAEEGRREGAVHVALIDLVTTAGIPQTITVYGLEGDYKNPDTFERSHFLCVYFDSWLEKEPEGRRMSLLRHAGISI